MSGPVHCGAKCTKNRWKNWKANLKKAGCSEKSGFSDRLFCGKLYPAYEQLTTTKSEKEKKLKDDSKAVRLATKDDGKVSKAFTWFHATSVNGGAMAIAVVNILVNDTIDFVLLKEGKPINAAVSGIIIVVMIFYPIRKHFPAIAEMKARMAAEKEAGEEIHVDAEA